MKRFAIALFLLSAPAVHSTTVIEPEPKSQILNNPFERLGKEANLIAKILEMIVVFRGLLR